MSRKFLQLTGALALTALIAGAFVALFVVKQRIVVTVAPAADAPSRGPDPIAELRADLAELKLEVGALDDAFARQLEMSHGALEESADARAAAQALELAKSREAVAAAGARIDALARELADERSRGADSQARLETTLASARPAAPEIASVQPAPALSAAAEPAVAAPAAADLEAPPAPRKKFLSFKLPERSFQFAGAQRFALIPSLSRVGFDARSTLHDFSGVTQAVAGELVVDLARAGERCDGTVRVELATLDTGMADRDAEMRKLLDVAERPAATFAWRAFDVAELDADARKLAGVARGVLTIHGVAREVAMPVRVEVDASDRLAVEGELALAMSDFGVEPPSKLGMISVEDRVSVWISLRARSLGAVEAARE